MGDVSLFDYAGIAVDTATDVRAAAERIRVRMKRTAEDIIAIGLDLIAAKERLPHGAFLPWIEAEFGMAGQTARRFMQVAEAYGDKNNIMLNLTPTALYELAAPSTPEPVRQIVEQKAEAGESITVEEVKRLKRELADKDTAAKKAEQVADRAKREAEAEKAKANDLLGQVNMLKENADAVRIKAEKEAEAKAAAERQRLLSEIETAKADAERVRQEVEDAARTQAEAAAQAELAKIDSDVRAARKKEAEARAAVDRLREQKGRLDAMIREQQDVAKRLSSVDHEVGELLKSADEIIRQQAMFMLVVDDVEFQADHPEKLRRVVAQLADQCGKMQGVLSSLYNHRLRVVEIDADVING